MAWQKTDSTLRRRMNQHGLGDLIEAGLICRQSEILYPGLFRAISVRNHTLHLEVSRSNQTAFTMIRGKLLHELKEYAEPRLLPPVSKIRLTII